MGRKSKETSQEPAVAVAVAVDSLFSALNPFRRKPQPDTAASPPQPGLVSAPLPEEAAPAEDGAPVTAEARKRRRERGGVSSNPSPDPDLLPKKRKKLETGDDGASPQSKKRKRKRKRDELEEAYERRRYGTDLKALEAAGSEGEAAVTHVGAKRKAEDVSSEMVVSKDGFDDESKLLRTVFIGNLPLKTKRKVLLKEFARFGEIESVRIRSVPIVDSKIPRKGAIMKGRINDAVDSMHAYIVFKDEQSAHAALSHNMAEVGGNHIRVDMACPPRKKMKGEGLLYDRKRTLFVGNLPFDVKDEELYQLFCGPSQSESTLEAVRVIRDPHTSLGKGIAYVLFKTREAANSTVKKRDLMIRGRPLRVSHAKSDAATPSKRKEPGRMRDFPHKRMAHSEPSSERNDKPKAISLSYQGLRASKSGVLKKASLRSPSSSHGSQGSKRTAEADHHMVNKTKRPAVAARKSKLMNKRKQESGTPENTRRNKKFRKH